MQLRELNGQFIANKTSHDVIKRDYIEQFHEFLISEQVANDLLKHQNHPNIDYWYLAIAKDLTIGDEQFYWEITVRDVVLQLPIKGIVKFEDNLPVLAFSWE